MAAIQTLLSPQVLTKVISQVAATSDWLINLLGVGPGGANEVYEGIEVSGWHKSSAR
jgi:hypothetical protein